MEKIDVSIVLNLHREALYLRPTLYSLNACASEAAENGINVELIAVFDRADEQTLSVFESTKLSGYVKVKTIMVDLGSLGMARNAGIDQAEGEFVWTADGDDLVSRNSLVRLFDAAKANKGEKVGFFMEYMVVFGENYHVVRYVGSEWLTAADFVFAHSFVSRIFISREAFKQIRYRDLQLKNGLAYEDWDLNSRLYSEGYYLTTVKNTILFYRNRFNSLLQQSNAGFSRLIPHSILFDSEFFRLKMNEARDINPDWPSFIKARKGFYDRNFANELLCDDSNVKFILESSRLEPEIEPHRVEKAPSYYTVPWDEKHWGFQLEYLYKMIGTKDFTDVLLVPWLNPGGAEKYILQILSELKSLGICNKVLVFFGQSSNKHEWTSVLPQDSVYIDLYNSFPSLNDSDRIKLVVRAILSLTKSGARLHLKACEFTHHTMEMFGVALSNHLNVYYYRFSDSYPKWMNNKTINPWGIKFIRQQSSNILKLISDCEFITLKDKMFIGQENVTHEVIYAKTKLSQRIVRANAKPRNRLLWASRVSIEKRPEFLIMLANNLINVYPEIKIDVYGVIAEPYKPSIFNLPNLKYCGKYTDFDHLPIDKYDAFIYTTVYDGLPNVLLEALSAGLPVIAPDVGGISEAVINGKTGFLIKDHEDDIELVKYYLDALNVLYSNWSSQHEISMNARALIANRHSSEAYAVSVARVFTMNNS